MYCTIHTGLFYKNQSSTLSYLLFIISDEENLWDEELRKFQHDHVLVTHFLVLQIFFKQHRHQIGFLILLFLSSNIWGFGSLSPSEKKKKKPNHFQNNDVLCKWNMSIPSSISSTASNSLRAPSCSAPRPPSSSICTTGGSGRRTGLGGG